MDRSCLVMLNVETRLQDRPKTQKFDTDVTRLVLLILRRLYYNKNDSD